MDQENSGSDNVYSSLWETFEFYSLNNSRIYHTTYTELHPFEIVQRLNNSIDLSHIPDYQFPHHYDVQFLIRQQIQHVQQPVESQIYQQNGAQQNNELDAQHASAANEGTRVHSEFYLALPNDTRIYYVTYTELQPFEVAQLLNNLSRQQQIQQQVQQPMESQIYQNSMDNDGTAASISSNDSNGTISDGM